MRRTYKNINKDQDINPYILENLQRALKYLSKRGGWTRGFNARDENDKSCDELSEEACSFCAYGSIIRAAHDLNVEKKVDENLVPAWLVTDFLRKTLWDSMDPGHKSIIYWNDIQVKKKTEVINGFKMAIKRIQKEMSTATE